MAKSLKQQLRERPDAREKVLTLDVLGGEPFECTIQRLTVMERDQLVTTYQLGHDGAQGRDAAIALVMVSVIDPEGALTIEEVRAMPAALVDAIATEALAFNGWTAKSQAALADQFRPAT
jgi:hypothetical protein